MEFMMLPNRETSKEMQYEDRVRIPAVLLEWIETPDGVALIEKIKKKSNARWIRLEKTSPGFSWAEICGDTPDLLRAAKALLEMHLAFQDDLQRAKNRTEKMEMKIEMTRKEFENGLRVEFSVPRDLIPLVFGKHHGNLTKAKQINGVDRIFLHDNVVRIRGKDPKAVRRARELLEYKDLGATYSAQKFSQVFGASNRAIHVICRESGCNNISVVEAGDLVHVHLVGVVAAVETAREMMEARLEYSAKMNEINADHLQIEKQLIKVDSDFGDYKHYRGPYSSTPDDGYFADGHRLLSNVDSKNSNRTYRNRRNFDGNHAFNSKMTSARRQYQSTAPNRAQGQQHRWMDSSPVRSDSQTNSQQQDFQRSKRNSKQSLSASKDHQKQIPNKPNVAKPDDPLNSSPAAKEQNNQDSQRKKSSRKLEQPKNASHASEEDVESKKQVGEQIEGVVATEMNGSGAVVENESGNSNSWRNRNSRGGKRYLKNKAKKIDSKVSLNGEATSSETSKPLQVAKKNNEDIESKQAVKVQDIGLDNPDKFPDDVETKTTPPENRVNLAAQGKDKMKRDSRRKKKPSKKMETGEKDSTHVDDSHKEINGIEPPKEKPIDTPIMPAKNSAIPECNSAKTIHEKELQDPPAPSSENDAAKKMKKSRPRGGRHRRKIPSKQANN